MNQTDHEDPKRMRKNFVSSRGCKNVLSIKEACTVKQILKWPAIPERLRVHSHPCRYESHRKCPSAGKIAAPKQGLEKGEKACVELKRKTGIEIVTRNQEEIASTSAWDPTTRKGDARRFPSGGVSIGGSWETVDLRPKVGNQRAKVKIHN